MIRYLFPKTDTFPRIVFFCCSFHYEFYCLVEKVYNVSNLFQVIEITDYRAQLYDYLKNRMTAIAPNLTVLVGELVGARLIAHAG